MIASQSLILNPSFGIFLALWLALPALSQYILPTSSNVSAPTVASCNTTFRYINQQLNHTDRQGPTFLQRYGIDTSSYKPGGPIIVLQGAESNSIGCLTDSALPVYAKELGGVICVLEHRYFGKSAPLGLNTSKADDWPIDDLQYLTLENVMLDTVTFVEWLKTTLPGGDKSKTIVTGPSYPGFLTAMYKVHYPEVFFGAIASSSVVTAFSNKPSDPSEYGVDTILNNLYTSLSYESAMKTKYAFKELRERLTSGSFAGLDKSLSLCYPPNSTDQADELINWIFSSQRWVAQYNSPAYHYPLNQVINATLKANNSMAVINASIKVYLENTKKSSCGDWLAHGRWPPLFSDQPNSPWWWLKCTYFPTQITLRHDNSIFGGYHPEEGTNINQICQKAFGIPVVNGDKLVEKYNLTQETLESQKRIIYSEGQYDPLRSVGPKPFHDSAEPDGARYLYISESYHGGDVGYVPELDLLPGYPPWPQPIVDAVNAEAQIMKGWIDGY